MKHRTFRRNKPRRSRTLHLYNHCSMPTYYCTYLSLRNTYYPFRVRCICLRITPDRSSTTHYMFHPSRPSRYRTSHRHSSLYNRLSLRNTYYPFRVRCIYLHITLDCSNKMYRTFHLSIHSHFRTSHQHLSLYNRQSRRNTHYPFREQCIYLHTILDYSNTMYRMFHLSIPGRLDKLLLHYHLDNCLLHHNKCCRFADQYNDFHHIESDQLNMWPHTFRLSIHFRFRTSYQHLSLYSRHLLRNTYYLSKDLCTYYHIRFAP